MNSSRIHYLIIGWVSLALFVLSLLAYWLLPQALISDYLLWIVPFFFLIALAGRFFNASKIRKDPRKSLAVSLASSGVKLVVYLAVLVIYGILNKEDAPAFFISFLVIYLVFTFMEVKLTLWEASR